MIDLRPSDQPGDPLGWGGNQAAHILIGATTCSVFVEMGAVVPTAIIATAYIWALWEISQYVRGGKLSDCLMDFSANMWGAVYCLAAGALWWPIASLFILVAGVLRRAR